MNMSWAHVYAKYKRGSVCCCSDLTLIYGFKGLDLHAFFEYTFQFCFAYIYWQSFPIPYNGILIGSLIGFLIMPSHHYLSSILIRFLLSLRKWVSPSMNRYRMFFVQMSTQPPNMHQKLTKHGRFCKQNNQLTTKSHDELEDNSMVPKGC